MSYHKTCKQFLIAFTTFFASWLSVYTCVCVYVGLPNNKITYWNFKFLLVNYLKLSIPCTQSLPACEKLLKRKPIDYVHFTVCESGPQTHRYLGRVYLDFQTLNYYDRGATDNVCLLHLHHVKSSSAPKHFTDSLFWFGSRIIYLIYIQLEVWCQIKCNEVFIIPPCIF